MTSKRPPRKAKPASPPAADSFHLLFDNHPIPMWIYDLESLTFLEVNEAAPAGGLSSPLQNHTQAQGGKQAVKSPFTPWEIEA